jgi:UDP-glucuronate 4-epimerase
MKKESKGCHHFFLVILFSIFPLLLHAKKILLTGGAGFIGSHVAQKLLERGDSIIIIDSINDAYDHHLKEYNLSLVEKSNLHHQLSIHRIDICNTTAIEEICSEEKPDVICHLAARAGVRTSIDNPQEYFRTNNDGTLSMFELARKCEIRHVVCASSSSVYGARENGPFRETDAVDKQSSPYGMTKRAGELIAYVYYHIFGISSANLRFFTVYGPRGRMDMAPFIFMDAMHHNNPITVYGDGSAIRDFTYVDDIVQGIILAIDHPYEYQIINLGRGEPIVLHDFIKIMESVIGKIAEIKYVPSFSGDVPQTHAAIEKAQGLFNYSPTTSVRKGLERMYEWYKNEYLLVTGHKRACRSEVFIFED